MRSVGNLRRKRESALSAPNTWERRGFAWRARLPIGEWTIDANGGTRETLLAAVLASPGHPRLARATEALELWWEAWWDHEEGTAAYGRGQR